MDAHDDALPAERARVERLLAARGAKPILLVSSDPFTGGEAAQWWRDVAAVGDIVIQKYFNAPAVHRAGPVLGSRRMRTSMRQVASGLFAINIPPSKLGFMLAFQTRPGTGGREGLKPASAWFEVAKLQALAAKQVARELSIAHIWSWGWGVFNEAGSDPDKQGAACVWSRRATRASVTRRGTSPSSTPTGGRVRSIFPAASAARSATRAHGQPDR